jgi:hypothetical protein
MTKQEVKAEYANYEDSSPNEGFANKVQNSLHHNLLNLRIAHEMEKTSING